MTSNFLTIVFAVFMAKEELITKTARSSKTVFLIIGLKQQLSKIDNSSLNTTHSARNLGFIFDLMNILLSLITIRYDTIEEINVDSKAEYTA